MAGGVRLAYKIAVGSSDGIHVNLKFGEVTKFLIYEVSDEIRLVEERSVENAAEIQETGENSCNAAGCSDAGCGGNGSGCSVHPM